MQISINELLTIQSILARSVVQPYSGCVSLQFSFTSLKVITAGKSDRSVELQVTNGIHLRIEQGSNKLWMIFRQIMRKKIAKTRPVSTILG